YLSRRLVTDAARSERTTWGRRMQGAFESWIGQEVVVQVALGQIRIRLRGMLLKERTGTLLMRPAVGSDIEIPKTTVLAIEELVRMPQYPRWLNASDARWTVQHSLFCRSAQSVPHRPMLTS